MADSRLRRVAVQYLQDARDRGLTPRYLRHMRATVLRFADWCEEKGVTAMTKVDAGMIAEYMGKFADMGGSTQRVQWCILRNLLGYAGNPVAETYRYRARGPDRFRVRWLSGDQVKMLLEAPLEPTERLLVGFGLYAGLRMREVLDMRVSEAQTALTTGWMIVRGKGAKSRPVCLHPKLRGDLRDYLDMTDLAPTAKLLPFGHQQYDARLRKVGSALGFVLSSHDLRRTHAAKLCEGDGLDIACLSLGHQNPEMTLRYSGVQLVRLQKAIDGIDWATGVQTPARPVI